MPGLGRVTKLAAFENLFHLFRNNVTDECQRSRKGLFINKIWSSEKPNPTKRSCGTVYYPVKMWF